MIVLEEVDELYNFQDLFVYRILNSIIILIQSILE
jgi:hypothetical protein